MKTILVINMPKDCYECPCVCDEFNSCQACNDRKREQDQKGIPSWCPLKPLPSKKHIPITKTFGTPFNVGKAKGWNACLDAITGGRE